MISLKNIRKEGNPIEKYFVEHKLPFFQGKGGFTRVEIIQLLRNSPCNPHQMSKILKKSYRTIRYHLDILEDNNILEKTDRSYDVKYSISSKFNIQLFEKLLNIGR